MPHVFCVPSQAQTLLPGTTVVDQSSVSLPGTKSVFRGLSMQAKKQIVIRRFCIFVLQIDADLINHYIDIHDANMEPIEALVYEGKYRYLGNPRPKNRYKT